MAIAYIAVGSNLGDRNKNIQKAIFLLRAHPQVNIIKISSIIETEPEGGPAQERFLNGAIAVDTDLPPKDLLNILQEIERGLGRQKAVKNGPRVIDLDILFYGDKIINKKDLKIPHPRLHKRQFVIKPLCQIAPEFIHPVLNKKIKDL